MGVFAELPPTTSKAGLLDAALTIAKERAAITGRMKAALLAGDTETALACAGELCGLTNRKPVARAEVLNNSKCEQGTPIGILTDAR